MKKGNLENFSLNHTVKEAAKKIYLAPSVKEYGSINDLVQSNGGLGNDGGSGNDDSAGSI